jgi:hypothetical protein
VLRLAPDASSGPLLLALVAERRRRMRDARALYEQALRADPQCADALEGLARLHKQGEEHARGFARKLALGAGGIAGVVFVERALLGGVSLAELIGPTLRGLVGFAAPAAFALTGALEIATRRPVRTWAWHWEQLSPMRQRLLGLLAVAVVFGTLVVSMTR